MAQRLYPLANRVYKLLRQVGVNQFFAISRGGSNHNPARVDDGGAAAKPQLIVFPDTIRPNHISLVFDCACLRKDTPMFDPREWPRGRNHERGDVLIGRKFSVHFWETEIVADAEAKAQVADCKARERIAWSKARLLFYWCDRIEMSLAILRNNLARGIDKNLGIVD